MTKLFFGENEFCCELEKVSFVEQIMSDVDGFEIVEDAGNADYIIYAKNCAANFPRIETAIADIEALLEKKKKDAKLIVSGCIAKSMNSEFELIQRLNHVLSKADYVVRDEIIFNIVEILKKGLLEREKSEFFDMPPYSSKAILRVADGCNHRCSFCKVHYMDFRLKSLSLDVIKEGIEEAVKNNAMVIQLVAPNLSQLGTDLYGKPVLPELLRYMRSINEIKWIFLQELCVSDLKDNDETVDELSTNQKVKCASMQFPSGSERITKLMNRGYKVEDLRRIVNAIRKGNPDIIFQTALMSGFPTEDEKDITETLSLVEELKYVVQDIRPYTNSVGVPASRLPQFSEEEKEARVKSLERVIEDWNAYIYGEICQRPSLVTSIVKGRPYIMAPDGAQYFFPEEVEKARVLGKQIKPGILI